MLRTPEGRSLVGIEARRVHAPRPELEIVPETVRQQRLDHRLAWNVNLAAGAIRASQIRSDKASQTRHVPIMLEIGLEAGVIGCDDRNIQAPRDLQCAVTQKIRCQRDMDDVRAERAQPLDSLPRQTEGHAIFRPRGQCHGRNGYEGALVGEGRDLCDGCKDEHFDALSLQMRNQSVQRQRDAVLDVVIGTCHERDAKRALIETGRPLLGGWLHL